MADTERWAGFRIRLWAFIGGRRYEVVGYNAAFELNTIPLASLTLAVGRNVDTLEAATIHDTYSEIKSKLLAEVFFARVQVGGTPDVQVDGPPVVEGTRIFRGEVIGTGWQRGLSGASFTIHLQHWLARLHSSSAVSGLSHPANPADWIYPASYFPSDIAAAGGEAGADPRWVPHTSLERGITVEQLTDELWLNVLHNWMKEVASREPIDTTLIPGLGDNPRNSGSAAALAALERMDQKGDFPVKLGMDLGDADADAITANISKFLAATVGRNAINTTLWGKLIDDWCGGLLCAVVPRVENALVIPMVGALRGKPFCTIRAGEYESADLSGRMPSSLRCVGVLHPVSMISGGNSNVAEFAGDTTGLAGLFPDPPGEDGLIMLVPAPEWLSDTQLAHQFSRAANGFGPDGDAPTRTAATAKHVGAPPVPDRDPREVRKSFESLLDAFAQHRFVLEKLKSRTGELTGRLRFDIAPGSQVQIEGGSEQFLRKDGLGQPIFAMVQRVTFSINAESNKANTSFTVAWIRNEVENSDDKFTVEKPPLYQEAWVGGNLIDGFKPPY